jgi:hypothetical protein
MIHTYVVNGTKWPWIVKGFRNGIGWQVVSFNMKVTFTYGIWFLFQAKNWKMTPHRLKLPWWSCTFYCDDFLSKNKETNCEIPKTQRFLSFNLSIKLKWHQDVTGMEWHCTTLLNVHDIMGWSSLRGQQDSLSQLMISSKQQFREHLKILLMPKRRTCFV